MATDLVTDVYGLTLPPLRSVDAHEYHALVQRNAAHLGRNYASDIAATVEQHAEEFAANPSLPLVFGLRVAHALLGRIDLVAVEPPKYGMGYWLGHASTGHGWATAAVQRLIEYASSELGGTDVFAGVSHGNQKSVAVLERSGFTLAVTFEDYDRYHLAIRA